MVNKKVRLAKRRAAASRAQLCVALLAFQRGLILVTLMLVVMVMLKRLGMSNSWASCSTAFLILPYVARPVLRPILARLPFHGWCLIVMQVGASVALWFAAGSMEPQGGGVEMWLLLSVAAIVGACHDVLAEDFGMSLYGSRRPGRLLVGVSMLVLSIVIGLGVTLMAAGDMEVMLRNVRQAWQTALKIPAGVMFAVAVLSAMVLPGAKHFGSVDSPTKWRFVARRWWSMPRQWVFASFVLLMAFQEVLVAKGLLMFVVDPGSSGGLSLGPHEAAFAYGTSGGFMMLLGLVLGYLSVRRCGLRRWAWPMVASAVLPDAVLLYLAYFMPSDFMVVCLCLAVECFGCGFALAGLVLYLRYYGYGRGNAGYWHSCLALVALSASVAGVVTGFIQDYFGYRMFFLMVIVTGLLAAFSVAMLRLVRVRRQA